MKTVKIQIPKHHTGQRRVVDEARRFNVLQCGRRFGKTTLGEQLVVNAAINGKPAGWFAPTYKTMVEQWKSLLRTLKPLIKESNKMEGRIHLVTDGRIDFWSLDDPDSGRGRKYKLVVIDEASIVRHLKEAWEHTIRPTLTDYRGSAWFLGTPKGRNYFHQLFVKGQNDNASGWKSWRFGSIDNPYLDEQEIQEARNDLPPHVFDQEYRGVPADDAGNPFGYNAIRACVADLSEGTPVAFGVDLAKSHDWTVVVGIDALGHVCILERWQSDWEQTTMKLRRMLAGVPSIIDSTGVGDPILERVSDGMAEGFKFTAPSKQQLMLGLCSSIHNREIKFPDGWLVNELETFQYEYHSGGRVTYKAPDGMHDDGVCALALAVKCYNEKRSAIPEVRVLAGGGDEFDNDDRVWTW